MDLDALKTHLTKILGTDELRKSRVWCKTGIQKAGEPIRIGLSELTMPFDGHCVFIDLSPKANWGHPVVYLLINASLDKHKRCDDQFPPFGEDVPVDWMLLKLY